MFILMNIGFLITHKFIIKDNVYHFEEWDTLDVILIIGMDFLAMFGQISMSLAYKFGSASKIAPFSNFETVFTILAGVFFFSYHFEFTDIFGIVTIVLSLSVPLALNILNEKK